MHGSPTDDSVVAAFRAEYIYSGNATKSGKKLGIPESTAREIAQRLNKDADFVAERRALRDQYLDDLVALRMKIVNKAVERFMAPAPEINAESGAVVTIIDKRADFGKLVLEAEKLAQNLARFDAEKSGNIPPEREVTIRIAPTVMPDGSSPSRD